MNNIYQIKPIELAVKPTAQKKANSTRSLQLDGIAFNAWLII